MEVSERAVSNILQLMKIISFRASRKCNNGYGVECLDDYCLCTPTNFDDAYA
jgi:hypothetical protein